MAYYVSFQTNGGLPVYNPVENVVSIPNLDNYIPYKAPDSVYSYSFDGWYYDESLSAQALTDDPISANTILYAKWIETQIGGYSITFETNGGTPVPTNLTNQVAIPDPLPSISKSGFTFVGWKWGNTTNAGDVTPGEPIYADATIYAVFTGANYNITYVLNGGTNNPNNPSTYSLGSSAIPLLTPTKANYNFAGWYEESTFVTRVYGIDVGSSGDKTFYAKWVNNYVVTWFSNGGSDVPNSENVTALPNPLPTTTKAGYTFNGWYYEPSFTNQAQAGDIVSGNKTVYAKWTKTSYTITYILDGGTNSVNNPLSYDIDSLIIFENASKSGYVFNGWFSDSQMTIAITGIAKGSTGNKTVYAKFTESPSGYSITYVENGGSPEQTNLTNQNALPNPLPSIGKIGSTFIGWFTDQELLNQAVAGATINANTTLYAKFVEGNNPIPVNPDTKRSGYIHANRKDTTPTDNSNKGITSGGVKAFVDGVKSIIQEQIDGLNASQNVVDIVGTKAELDVYNTSNLLNNDKIQVLQDETHDGSSTYYNWNLSVWTYIGRTGTGYTKNEADNLLSGKVDKIPDYGLTKNDYNDTEKSKVADNTTARHTHSNKSILDNTTASFTTEDKTLLSSINSKVEVPVNRLIYCDINNNYSFINPTRIEYLSRVAYFKVKEGRFKCKYTNASGRKWSFPSGTLLNGTSTIISTSTDEIVDVMITASTGYVALYSNNWIGSYQLDASDSNCIIGDLSDLPALTYLLNLYGCALVTGSLKDLPPLTDTVSLNRCSLITGDLKDLPRVTYYLDLYNCRLITGELKDLPKLTYYLNLNNCSLVTGDLSELPRLTNALDLNGCSLITGSLKDLPALTYYLRLNGCLLINGSLADLPAVTYYFDLGGCPLITGAYTQVSGDNVPTTTILTGTGLSATDMDNTLIAYAATTKNGGSFTATNKNRTSASDAAVETLVNRGWTINGLVKI